MDHLRRRIICRHLLYGWILILPVFVGGCALQDMILGGVKTDYGITFDAIDDGTASYLQDVLDERVEQRTALVSKDDPEDERARQENYVEETIRADLVKALHAKGYYTAKVTYQDGAEKFSGRYIVAQGPQYSIATVDVLPEQYRPLLNAALIETGAPLDAAQVLRAQGEFYNNIQKDRCYFSLSVKNEVVLNHQNYHGDIDFLVDAGAEGVFGPLSFAGQKRVKESYMQKLLHWREGECFRREKLEDYKTRLLQSGLFSKADVILPEAPDENGVVPVVFEVRERAHRSISAGITYYSDEGPGAVFGWEHRNLFGSAEKLKADLGVSSLKQSLSLDFTKPYFVRKDQTLSLNSAIRRQDTDAFEELGLDFGGKVSRNFTKALSGSSGVDLTLTQIDDHTTQTKKTYGLVSLPQILSYDTRDDTLDPHKGFNLTGSFEPFFDAFGKSDPFTKAQFSGSTYLAVSKTPDTVIAAKAGIGSIWGADVENIPATERFYAGGGGSVRGYGYQEVGPQLNGDPTGGLSIVNFSLELRSRVTEKFGGVAFVDGASVSEDPTPKFNNNAIGAGVGVRYYSDFGPIRFDVAVPLTQKEDLDQKFQFYISIGQAF